MSDHLCNCSTCLTEQCGFNPKCTAITNAVFKSNVKTIHWFTKIWGCARHPQAREYMMQPVISELADRMKECNDKGGSNAAYLAYAYALDLIRGDAK